MTRQVRYSEIYTKQDRLPYSDTEVIHQVTGLSQDFHRVSPPLVKQSWRRWVTSEWHPPITKASRYFRSAIESKEVRLKRRDESVIMVPRIIKHVHRTTTIVIILKWMERMHERVTEKLLDVGKFLASTSVSSILRLSQSRSFVIAWPHAAQNHQNL